MTPYTELRNAVSEYFCTESTPRQMSNAYKIICQHLTDNEHQRVMDAMYREVEETYDSFLADTGRV